MGAHPLPSSFVGLLLLLFIVSIRTDGEGRDKILSIDSRRLEKGNHNDHNDHLNNLRGDTDSKPTIYVYSGMGTSTGIKKSHVH